MDRVVTSKYFWSTDEGCHEETLYADVRALVANGKLGLQETLEEWNGLFTRHGLKINIEKTDMLHIGHYRGKSWTSSCRGETDSGGQFRVSRSSSVRTWKDGERGTSKSTGRTGEE